MRFSLCQPLPAKIFLFRFSEKYDHLSASRADRKGRFAIVTNVGAGCDGRERHI
jgi:hypothetical protein